VAKEPYPLAAARELRDRAVDEAAATLAATVAEHEEAAARLAQAEQALANHDAEGEAFEAAERARGPSSAAVFQQAQAFRQMRAETRVQLAEAIAATRLVLAQRKDQVSEAREALATARAEAEAVARHEERWREEKRRAAEKKEELEAEDAIQARLQSKKPH